MKRRIAVLLDDAQFTAGLDESPAAEAVWNVLPVEGHCSEWGDEFYFDTGRRIAVEADRETVDPGDLAYWPPGRAICVFFGPTPISGPGEIRPAGPVAVFGRLEGDPARLKDLRPRRIRVEAVAD